MRQALPQATASSSISWLKSAKFYSAPELKGQEGATPNLIVVGGYSHDEFEMLITKGIPSGERKFKNALMGEVARSRFRHVTPHERDALYAYLKARVEQPQ